MLLQDLITRFNTKKMAGTVGVGPTSLGFQASAKTASATSPRKMAGTEGIEPPTPSASTKRSTDELRPRGTRYRKPPKGLLNVSSWDVRFIFISQFPKSDSNSEAEDRELLILMQSPSGHLPKAAYQNFCVSSKAAYQNFCV